MKTRFLACALLASGHASVALLAACSSSSQGAPAADAGGDDGASSTTDSPATSDADSSSMADASSGDGSMPGHDGSAVIDSSSDGTTRSDSGDAAIADSADAGPDSTVAADAGADAADAAPDQYVARCNPASTFGAPVPLSSLNAQLLGAENARLMPDELTVYLSASADGGSGEAIFSALRASVDAGFAPASPVPGVNSTGNQRGPTVTADGLHLYAFTGTGNYQISVTSRGSTGAQFGALSPVTAVNGTTNDSNPYVLPDHSALYFSSDRTGGAGGYDLYRAPVVGGVVQSPVAVPGVVNTTANEQGPVVTPDELTMYFSSNQAGGGNLDIYVSRRASTGVNFGAPTSVAELNTPAIDFPTWISADGCMLYFTSQRLPDGGTANNYGVYYAQRGP